MTNNEKQATETTDLARVRAFFAGRGKTVVSFVGYSGSGYEDAARMLRDAASVLDGFSPRSTIVNIGATDAGIGAVYSLAKARGFETTGIVSVLAAREGMSPSDHVDRVFLIDDDTWGGLIDGTDRLSPTSRAIVENSDMLVGIGGGPIARDELLEARRQGRMVVFFPADMNHRNAAESAARSASQPPINLAGAAHDAFEDTTR